MILKIIYIWFYAVVLQSNQIQIWRYVDVITNTFGTLLYKNGSKINKIVYLGMFNVLFVSSKN